MIGKAGAAHPDFFALYRLRMADKTTLFPGALHRATAAKGVRFVTDAALDDVLAHVAVALVVGDRRDGPVDRDFMKVGAAQAGQLGV